MRIWAASFGFQRLLKTPLEAFTARRLYSTAGLLHCCQFSPRPSAPRSVPPPHPSPLPPFISFLMSALYPVPPSPPIPAPSLPAGDGARDAAQQPHGHGTTGTTVRQYGCAILHTVRQQRRDIVHACRTTSSDAWHAVHGVHMMAVYRETGLCRETGFQYGSSNACACVSYRCRGRYRWGGLACPQKGHALRPSAKPGVFISLPTQSLLYTQLKAPGLDYVLPLEWLHCHHLNPHSPHR